MNALRGEASFKAGTADYTLTYDANVFCNLEDDTGLGVNELVAEMQGSPSFTMLRRMVCAGLQPKHPNTTLIKAGDVMSDAGIEVITDALQRAMQAAMPEVAEEDESPPKPRSRKAAKK